MIFNDLRSGESGAGHGFVHRRWMLLLNFLIF